MPTNNPGEQTSQIPLQPPASGAESGVYLVFHNVNEETMFEVNPALWKAQDQSYRLVALVEAHSLEEAFRLTNHIEGDWRKNALVKSVSDIPSRSTSVGDVITVNGQIWLVDQAGFRQVTSEEVDK